MRRTPEITLPVRLQPGAGALPEQLADQLRELIAAQVLAPGDPVPSSRAMAEHLGISRGSVVAGYDQLLAEGYLSASTGRATVVNPQLRRGSPASAALDSSGLDRGLRRSRPSSRTSVDRGVGRSGLEGCLATGRGRPSRPSAARPRVTRTARRMG